MTSNKAAGAETLDNPLADADRVREAVHDLVDQAQAVQQTLCSQLIELDELPALLAVNDLLKRASAKLDELESHLMAARE